MSNQFIESLVSKYDEDNTNYSKWVNDQIVDHFSQMKPSTSAIDPQRLGPQSVLYSKIKSKLIDKCMPLEVTETNEQTKLFNKMNLRQQLTYQMQSRAVDTNKWVHNLEILPSNIAGIRMANGSVEGLKRMRSTVNTTKLQAKSDTINVGELMKILLPALSDPDAKINAVICALLLVTGRRTYEIAKTAELYLAIDMKPSGYLALFSGQAKSGLFDTDDYRIPLLAPFNLCKDALDRVRKENNVHLNSEGVNDKYSRGLNNYLKRVTGLPLTPHSLRSVYAMSLFELQPKNDRKNLIGVISQALGHANPSNATFYQRTHVENVALWKPIKEEKEIVKEIEADDGWITMNLPDRKRVAVIEEMMLKKIKITASALRTAMGGTMHVSARVISNNQTRIDEFNDSLE
jgi:hypothetical protein